MKARVALELWWREASRLKGGGILGNKRPDVHVDAQVLSVESFGEGKKGGTSGEDVVHLKIVESGENFGCFAANRTWDGGRD